MSPCGPMRLSASHTEWVGHRGPNPRETAETRDGRDGTEGNAPTKLLSTLGGGPAFVACSWSISLGRESSLKGMGEGNLEKGALSNDVASGCSVYACSGVPRMGCWSARWVPKDWASARSIARPAGAVGTLARARAYSPIPSTCCRRVRSPPRVAARPAGLLAGRRTSADAARAPSSLAPGIREDVPRLEAGG